MNLAGGVGAAAVGNTPTPQLRALAVAALAHYDGATKYGAWNWRQAGVRASIYLDAAQRHLTRWTNGETHDPDSGVHHLGHALACLNILIDAEAAGMLNDDRPPAIDIAALYATLTPEVARIAAKNAAHSPRHYNIWDVPS